MFQQRRRGSPVLCPRLKFSGPRVRAESAEFGVQGLAFRPQDVGFQVFGCRVAYLGLSQCDSMIGSERH